MFDQQREAPDPYEQPIGEPAASGDSATPRLADLRCLWCLTPMESKTLFSGTQVCCPTCHASGPVEPTLEDAFRVVAAITKGEPALAAKVASLTAEIAALRGEVESARRFVEAAVEQRERSQDVVAKASAEMSKLGTRVVSAEEEAAWASRERNEAQAEITRLKAEIEELKQWRRLPLEVRPSTNRAAGGVELRAVRTEGRAKEGRP